MRPKLRHWVQAIALAAIHPRSAIRFGQAMNRLERLEADQNIAGLLAALDDEATWRGTSVAGQAALALGRLRATEHVERIRPLMRSRANITRHCALYALAELRDRGAIGGAVELLHDDDAPLRAMAARMLGEVGAIEATAQLQALVGDDPHPGVRADAQRALTLLESSPHGSDVEA